MVAYLFRVMLFCMGRGFLARFLKYLALAASHGGTCIFRRLADAAGIHEFLRVLVVGTRRRAVAFAFVRLLLLIGHDVLRVMGSPIEDNVHLRPSVPLVP